MHKRFNIIVLLFFLIAGSVRAENSPQRNPSRAPQMSARSQGDEIRSEFIAPAMKEKFISKIRKIGGDLSEITITSPSDLSNLSLGDTVLKSVVTVFNQFGELPLRTKDYVFENMTVEECRKAAARLRTDIVGIPVIKASSFDFYLYDRRTPYYIYYHSEPVPPAVASRMNETIAASYVGQLVRRSLYRYVEDQYYELPRSSEPPVLKGTIPRWVASPESVAVVNKDSLSRVYAGMSMGGAFTHAPWVGFQSTNLLSLQLGLRVYDRYFFEASGEAFTYNTFVGSVKYVFHNSDTAFQFATGLGFGMLTNKYTMVLDPTLGFADGSMFIVPSGAILFPIGDAYFKVESRLYVGITSPSYIFTLMPGVMLRF